MFTILSSFRVFSLLSIWFAVAVFSYFGFALPQTSGLYSISLTFQRARTLVP